MPHRDRLVSVRVERLAQCLDGFDAVALKQPAQLLQRHLHALMQLRRRSSTLTSHGAFEDVENGQQILDEGFLFRRRLLLRIAPGALAEIIEVRGQTQIVILLRGQRRLEQGGISRRRFRDWWR